MLRKLTLRNFVHFHKEQTFEFKGGSYFFIGENRSGKSCTLEAVRRCMSTSKNLFMSTSHEKDNPSCIICEYASNHDDGQQRRIYSCVVSVPGENEVKVKVVIVKSKTNKLFVDLVKKNKHGYPVNGMFSMNYADVKSIQTLMEEELSTESLINFVLGRIINTDTYLSFIAEAEEINCVVETDCEKYLRQTIDMEVVITEPMRSVSVAQWSNSPKFDILSRMPESDDRFLYEMRFNSDIITWYFDNQTISAEERNNVDHAFNDLTESSRLRFENRKGVLHVIDNGNIVTLEKAPEGLLEAKICAILLSVKQFKTICLEEPGKGMHVQMIERLRNLALKEGQNKTVIMITHRPAFINTCNIEKIFFFRPSLDQKGRPLFKSIHGDKLLPKKVPADHNLSTIFFASRVLLVEGKSDEQFISAMKSTLLGDRDLANDILQVAESKITVDQLYRFLSSLQVMVLNGERNKLKFENICKALDLERYFILDYDAILDCNESTSTKNFFGDFVLEDLTDEFKSNGVTVLESRGIFVWARPAPGPEQPNQKSGTIEYAMIMLINEVGEKLKSLFDDNNAALNWDFREGIKRKLFKDRKLTEDNIDAVVRGVIQACLEHKDSDLYRLMKFIIQGAVIRAGKH